MRIMIAAAGSRGDVAPYTGLGVELSRAGYDVALAATETFAPLAREAGLGFRSLPADTRGHGEVTGRRDLMRAASAFITELGQGFADAVDKGTDLLLLSTTTTPLGWHLTEATGTPSLGVYLQPTVPTGDFPPVVTGSRSLGRVGNRAIGRLALRMADRVYEPAVAQLRHHLALPRCSASEMRRRQEQANWPILHGVSTALVPRPSDWRPGLDVVGNWWPHHEPADRLPSDLEDFLSAGPRPVLIGFGSMASGDGERLSEIAVRALRRAGLRGILQAGTAGLAADGDGLLTIGDVPHALLFPRLAAVVHHGGAGTSAAALRAGVAAVPVPVTADQPFWTKRLAALGAATDPIPFRYLTVERLADSLRQVVKEQAHSRAAARAARHMATENGARRALEAIRQLTGG
ncbi:glycosyltransferase [Streptomyces antibioticus]|uniref:Glycosyltransferase family 1 protein n=1 Tax=Streptomyces antibioticus TaxID=1890 RepID=A0AAE6Y2J8_STRAT|nr:glycosyltransferase [Streptomyces antibioticus]OOQ54602.1 UDP-glucose--sterol glucosyltransferase [Streptomyces antibioticus]QIT42225.1 glycosyltransferase family 1 protein [Streptomyces antibioticus]